MRLANKKAIVTGANRSIGQAIAWTLAQEGADVVVSYRSDEKGAKKTIENVQKEKRKGKAIYADFSKIEEVTSFFKQALDFLGHVDILVNNAAGYDTSPFLKVDLNQFEHVLKLGVSVPMLLIQLTANHMIEKHISGSIVNISSISGIRPYPNRVAHSSAKAALNMLTQNTALELASHGIRVNAIAPGAIPYENELASSLDIPLNRSGTPTDIANGVVFLASQESSWMTGQILVIDGGQSLSF